MKQASFITSAFCLALLASLPTAASDVNAAAAPRVPVLLELFTSEGCSSCPPADRLLETLDQEQPVPGADLIVISEHVDYWNHLGWSDPFSAPLYSARQRDYASRLKTGEVYTPQLVVDGRAEFVGSDRALALNAIQQTVHDPKYSLAVTASRAGTVHIEAPAQPERGAAKLDLYVVLAADRMHSEVARGENAGRSLSHVAVAYSFAKAGSWKPSDALTRDVHVDLKSGDTRVIAFLQDPRTARVVAVAQARGAQARI